MAKRIFSAVFNGLRKRLFVADGRSQVENYVLLLRLENLLPLSTRLAQTDLAQLMVHLVMRIRSALRADNSVQMISQGVFSAVLQAKSEGEAKALAARLQARGQQGMTIGGQEIVPVLTGMVMPMAKNSLPARSLAIEQAQSRLLKLPDICIGQITFVSNTEVSGQNSVSEVGTYIPKDIRFQPKICCNSGEITGFSVTTRPHRYHTEPSGFLNHELLETALDALIQWEAGGWEVPTVTVFASNSDICTAGFPEMILESLQKRGLKPHRLVLTFSGQPGLVNGSPVLRKNLDKLLSAGCLLELADFGHGYGDLAMIHRFQIHGIRIAGSFTAGSDIDPNQQRMMLAIFAMAEQLNIKTLADGIETKNEHSYLAQLGCDEVEGPAIAGPMPLSETFNFLTRHHESAKALPTLPKRNTL